MAALTQTCLQILATGFNVALKSVIASKNTAGTLTNTAAIAIVRMYKAY